MNSLIKLKSYFLFSIIFGLLCNVTVHSQNANQSFKKIRYIYDGTGNFVEDIQFYNEQSGELVSSFNLKENNPYIDLPFHEIKDVFLTYELSGVRLNDIKLNKGNLNIIAGLPDDLKLTTEGAISFSKVYEANPEYTFITYYFNVGSGEEIIAYSVIIYVFNSNGEIIKIIDDISAPVGYQVITNNGRYLAVGYHATIDINTNILSQDGCLIYNLIDDGIIDQKAPKGFSWSSPMVIGNLIATRHENSMSVYYYIFDFDTNKKYSHVFDQSIIKKGQLKDINEEGFVFEISNSNSGNYKVVSYINDFREEVIK